MKLALLAGNRFSPWHLEAFALLSPEIACTAFRAESEIQRHFTERGADTLPFPIEPVYFDTQAGPLPRRVWNQFAERYRGRAPEVLSFHERLAGYDALLSWELFTPWTREALAAKRAHGMPLHLMVWDNILYNNEETPEKRATKRQALREADTFLVHTERSRLMLELEGAPPERIRMIPPGVDLHAFAPGVGERASLGLSDDDFVVLFVGWLLPRKGIDFLLPAIRQLANARQTSGRRVRLVIAGSGPGEDRVRALVSRLGLDAACVFAGARPYAQMPTLFRSADVFVLPSIATDTWQEQFGMSLIEAMACGIPCIATQSGAIPEILGDAGLLCQPNDMLALHDALAQLARDPELRRELAHRERERAERLFGLDAYSQALRGLLRSGA